MNAIKNILILSLTGFIFAMLVLAQENSKDRSDFPVLRGPYFGQKIPGMTPEIFLPGLLNNETRGAFCSVFSPEGNEFYYVRYLRNDESPGVLAYMKQNENIWSRPEVLPFTSGTDSDNDMCMSYDGRSIYFRSWRALPDGVKPDKHSYLWVAERTNNQWSDAQPLLCKGEAVRTGYPSISRNSTLYFTCSQDNIKGIYRSKLKNGVYDKPEFVYQVIASKATEGDMFVAPDETYMIISCWDHPGNVGGPKGDLYITFRRNDGSWTDAINMGERINTACGENCPTVSPDGRYFFFHRYCEETKKGDTYWLDAKIIEDLKPNELK